MPENEEKYSNLFEYSNDVIFLHDLEGNIIDVNRKGLEVLGYSKPEMVSLNVAGLHPEGALPASREAFERLKRDGSVNFEIDFKKKNGDTFTTEVSSSIFKAGGKSLVQGIVRDVTEQRRAEKSLREKEESFRVFFEQAPAYCYRISPEGFIIDVNRWALKTLGYEKEELVGKPLETIYAPESLDRFKELFETWRTTGRLENEEINIITKSCEERVVLLNAGMVRTPEGDAAYSLSIQQDITERKRADEALLKSKNRLKEAEKVAKLGYYVYNIKADSWTSSEQLDDIFGIEEDYKRDVSGWVDIVHPDYRETMLNYFQYNVLTQHRKFDKEYKIVNLKTGQEGWVHGLGSLKFDDTGNPVEMFGTIQDINDKKKTEEALKIKIDEVERINRLMVGRELKMGEMKEKIRGLQSQIEQLRGRPLYSLE